MSKNTKSSSSAFKTIKIYYIFAVKYKLMLTLILILLPVVTVSANVLLPLIYAEAINKVSTLIGSKLPLMDTFGQLFWQSLVLITIAWVGWRIIGFTLSTFEFRIKRDLEQHIFKHLTTHSYDFHANSFSGSLVAQTNRMTNSFERLFDTIYFDLLTLVIKVIAIMVVLIPRSPMASGLIMAWVVGFVLIMTYLQIKKTPFSRRAAEADSKVTATIADSLTNIYTIITFGRKKAEQKYFNQTSQKRYKIAVKDWHLSEFIYGFQGIVMFVIEALLIWVMILQALNGTISLGEIVLVQIYLLSITGSMWNFGRVVRNIERSLSDAHEMTITLGQVHAVKDPIKPQIININEGAIKFNNVTFKYDGGKGLFNNLNLTIQPGQKIGLVGPSGGGKSTITKLLLRLMDIQSGQISIDGQDISKIKQDELRQHIAYVPQEPILFHRSLKDNIAYGNLNSSDNEIIKASKGSHADEFIKDLKDGYNTLVGERGVKLSGGQRQRVAIARAMLKTNSPVLLLDEATSALDSENEKFIQDGLWKLMQNRTTIVIAHRLSTIQHMDRIIVIDKGTIIEDGSHEQLLALENGMYAKLWQRQSGGFIAN